MSMYTPRSGGSRPAAIGKGPRLPDDDNPSWEVIARRRAKDIAFIQQIRTASLVELQALLKESKGWRKVAIERRIQVHSQNSES